MEGYALGGTLFGLLILSGLFSGSETALFSIAPLRLREMKESEHPGDRAVAEAMERPRRILVTILLSNLVVNILAASLGTAFAIRVSGDAGQGVLVATLAMTFLVLVFGEIGPKTATYHFAEPVARAVARPLLLLQRVLTPVAGPLVHLTERILRGSVEERKEVDFAEAETMLRLARSEGEVQAHEAALVRGVLELGESPVEEVMTPRTEIFSLPAGMTAGEARSRAAGAGYSKIPVATDEPDEIVGTVTALDLLLAAEEQTVRELAHEAIWVPEVKPALSLLEEFRATGQRIALVVDEHGHLSGLVTLTDLLEEISGEIIEGGDLHKVVYERLSAEVVIVPARMEIRYFNEEFGTDLTADAETLGGMLLERTGCIPQRDFRWTEDGVEFCVLKAAPHRVLTLEVHVPTEPSSAPDTPEPGEKADDA